MVPGRPPFWKFDTVDPTSPWFTRSCMKTPEWTFAKVGTTVHDNISEVLIAGSLSYLYSWLPIALVYLHRGTSHIGSCWHVFSGRAAIGLSFREHKRRNGEICPFSCSASKAMFYHRLIEVCGFINPWIQTALFLIIAIAAASAAVSWQFAGWISPIPPRLYSTAVNKVWRLQCGQRF